MSSTISIYTKTPLHQQLQLLRTMRAGRRMERLVLLPFNVGCVSESSIAIANHHRRSRSRPSSSNPPIVKNNNRSPPPSTIRRRLEEDDDSLSGDDGDAAAKLPAGNISAGFHRFLKSFKSTFGNNIDEDEEETEEEGIMEIGLPTDVKHVTHIGFDDHEAISSSSSSLASASSSHSTGVDHRPSILCQCGGWENLSGPQSHHHRQLLCLHHSSSFVRPEQLTTASPRAADPVHNVVSTSAAC